MNNTEIENLKDKITEMVAMIQEIKSNLDDPLLFERDWIRVEMFSREIGIEWARIHRPSKLID